MVKRIDKAKEHKRLSRQHGQPSKTRAIPDRRRKPAKHGKRATEQELQAAYRRFMRESDPRRLHARFHALVDALFAH